MASSLAKNGTRSTPTDATTRNTATMASPVSQRGTPAHRRSGPALSNFTTLPSGALGAMEALRYNSPCYRCPSPARSRRGPAMISVLETIDLAARRGFSHLFSGLAVSGEPGCALVVTGANGTGKTTLLRILAGLCAPFAGRVRWRGQDVAPFAQTLRQDVVFCGHLPALKDELTAEENLASLVALAGATIEPAHVRHALATVALERQARLPARALSQGQ